jgi:hypothetical protein
MTDAWQAREIAHVEELSKAKNRAYELGYKDGHRKGYEVGLQEGAEQKTGANSGADERGLGDGLREGPAEASMMDVRVPESVKLFLDITGWGLETAAKALGWNSKWGAGTLQEAADYIYEKQKALGLTGETARTLSNLDDEELDEGDEGESGN